MIYYSFHVNDSGAIEEIDHKDANGEKTLICKMYEEEEYNKLNDILHSLEDYILNERALNVFKESNTIPFEIRKAKVLQKEKKLGFFKKYKTFYYYQLLFACDNTNECYNWIDFTKSEIIALDRTTDQEVIIRSHQHTLELIEENKLNSGLGYKFVARKVVFGENFNNDIDLFRIPLYSWAVYVSKRLKAKLIEASIKDIRFAESKEQIGKVWKPYFPVIEFTN